MGGISRERAILVAAITIVFSVVTLLRKVSLKTLTPLQFEMISGIMHFMLVPVFYYLAKKTSEDLTVWDSRDVIVALIAIILNIAASVTFMYVLRGGNDAGVMSSLVSASPVITLMLSALFLGEQPTFRSAVGVALVLVGITITAWR